jgi:hypothetical protein
MIIQIKELDMEFTLPNTWADVPLSKYVKFLKHLAPRTPAILTTLLTGTKEEYSKLVGKISPLEWSKVLYFCAEYISFWGDVDLDILTGENELGKFDAGVLLSLYFEVERILQSDVLDKESRFFTWQEETYYFPKEHLRDTTLIEFAEAAQFEHFVSELSTDKRWEVMSKIIAILCRKKNEKYKMSEEWLNTRSALFEHLPMDIVLNLSFFLQAQSVSYNKDFLIYGLAQKITQTKAR